MVRIYWEEHNFLKYIKENLKSLKKKEKKKLNFFYGGSSTQVSCGKIAQF